MSKSIRCQDNDHNFIELTQAPKIMCTKCGEMRVFEAAPVPYPYYYPVYPYVTPVRWYPTWYGSTTGNVTYTVDSVITNAAATNTAITSSSGW